ncbi:hypothetical protein DSO57_1024497 [Entomophthora muscae]|uniref:Uncharacterized protein n=1 Tax=Entomophthora muscae TaxID=34485 RepID=A0ACC2SFZ3_9FUNG|nr:hypothetical protein DSO57_1024497 [Entomophthora muscae]
MLSESYNSEDDDINIISDDYCDNRQPRSTESSSLSSAQYVSEQIDSAGLESSPKPVPAGNETAPPLQLDPALTEKQTWVKSMRLKFCRRKEFEITFGMIHDDGTINQDYFRPKLHELQRNHEDIIDQMESKKWTDEHKAKLAKGILECGIGKFKEISEKYLPDWVKLISLNSLLKFYLYIGV